MVSYIANVLQLKPYNTHNSLEWPTIVSATEKPKEFVHQLC